jgi:hypothetical protein
MHARMDLDLDLDLDGINLGIEMKDLDSFGGHRG